MATRKPVAVASSTPLSEVDPATDTLDAKLQVSATSRVLGRTTAGSGAHEELTVSGVLDIIGSTRGSLLYRGASGWAILTPGTSGHVLTSNGSGADPSYQATAGGSPSVISPSQITATQNDYAPTGWAAATLVRLDGDNGIRMITGFSAETSGEEKLLTNIGSYPIYLAPQHASSTAANRIAYFEEIVIPPGKSCRIAYDGTSSRWRPTMTPADNYYMTRRTIHYDKVIGKFPEGVTEDVHLTYAGSGNVNTVVPSTTTRPWASWTMDNGTNATGDKSLYFLKTVDYMAYQSAAHIATKCMFTTPSSLSTGTQRYFIRHVISASPATLLTNVNNTLGIRYKDDINSGKWECYSRNNSGTETTADSGITVAANTTYETLISINKANTEATFMIDGVVVARITTNLPSANNVGAGIQFGSTVGTGTKTFYIHRLMAVAIAP